MRTCHLTRTGTSKSNYYVLEANTASHTMADVPSKLITGMEGEGLLLTMEDPRGPEPPAAGTRNSEAGGTEPAEESWGGPPGPAGPPPIPTPLPPTQPPLMVRSKPPPARAPVPPGSSGRPRSSWRQRGCVSRMRVTMASNIIGWRSRPLAQMSGIWVCVVGDWVQGNLYD